MILVSGLLHSVASWLVCLIRARARLMMEKDDLGWEGSACLIKMERIIMKEGKNAGIEREEEETRERESLSFPPSLRSTATLTVAWLCLGLVPGCRDSRPITENKRYFWKAISGDFNPC